MSKLVAGDSHFNGKGTRWMRKSGQRRRVASQNIQAFLMYGWLFNRLEPHESKAIPAKEHCRRYRVNYPEKFHASQRKSYRKMMLEAGNRKAAYLVTKVKNDRTYNKRVKLETLTRYGPLRELKCAWPECSIVDIDMLTLDHVNNGGNIERKAWCNQGGVAMYGKLRKLGFPSGYQTLCANHQLKKDLLRRRELCQKKQLLGLKFSLNF